MKKDKSTMARCPWANANEKMKEYHDKEWGVPVFDDYKQFEILMLEALQTGLSWNTILQKREIFKKIFDEFNFDKIAKYNDNDIKRAMETRGMIKSKRKIEAIIHNARCFQKIRTEFGSFSSYIWNFTENKTLIYESSIKGAQPSKNELSDKIAKDLKRRGLKFVGSITVYSYLQASGVILDHLETCPRFAEIVKMIGNRKIVLK